ncbi:hypothetical protein LGQ02_05345 [Bacillus shivajii]|uniref:hypothetical protein n=1 Tax=Bacillus shivajii TaxID=1983719 RepID=UPI001CFA7E46|nr:hypothetical protein [Bacillus shivajii]UCZ54186.1 hypothetical protein LGQ02_05345 [Bacillus shivajii]
MFSSDRMWYWLMSGIFFIVSATTIISIWTNGEREWGFPTHVFVIGLFFSVGAFFVWRKGKESYPYAYLLLLCALYAFVIVFFTMIRTTSG